MAHHRPGSSLTLALKLAAFPDPLLTLTWGPIQTWARLCWDPGRNQGVLRGAWAEPRKFFQEGKAVFARVKGPARALQYALARIGWSAPSPVLL